MKYFKYLFSYLSLAIGYIGLYFGGWTTFLLVFYAFGLIPLVELFLEGTKYNLSKDEEKIMAKDKIFDYLIYLSVPLHYGLLVMFLFSFQRDLTWWEIVGNISILGMSCGVYGINVAHELGHRTTKHEQFMAKALLLTSQYMHFFIEHNRGHHNRVSTDEDPASSRLNEPLYIFWMRSVVMSYVSAWKLERFRLSKMGRSILSFRNEMIWYTIIQVAFIGVIAWYFGWTVMVYYLIGAIIGFLLLETVNYIEHYGLRRKRGDHGYHKVLPVHSWNSNHPLGRLILFELSRHSDHHFRANRKYQILRYHEDSPQMPTGYPGMMVLSLFPPLWFKVMNPRVKGLQERYESKLAA
jgi:alkane 1-monooxygenase